jgi:glycosyltransferase involved in cell wall biosynthesis
MTPRSGRMPASLIEISVIVPAKDADSTLPDLIAALKGQDSELTYEVLIVDDGSTDCTSEIAETAGHPVELITASASRGAGSARNLGAARARGRVFAFTDADCIPTPSWLRKGRAALANADLVQGAVRPDPMTHVSSPYARSLEVTYERGFYETANIWVSRELFESLGGFEDWLPPVGGRPQGEDTLFGWRARRAGAKVRFAPDVLVHHAVIPQTRGEWILDRWRWQVLPSLVGRVPELRTHTLYRRWFFEHRTAAFDVALGGVIMALLLRRGLPLVLALRYISLLVEEANQLPSAEAVSYGLTRVAADMVSFAALSKGSWIAREVVL